MIQMGIINKKMILFQKCNKLKKKKRGINHKESLIKIS